MVSKILAESTISKLLSSLQLHKKIGWVQIGKIRLPLRNHLSRYRVQIIRESNYEDLSEAITYCDFCDSMPCKCKEK